MKNFYSVSGNVGKYRNLVLDGKIQSLDSKLPITLETHINLLTDELFLNLSRGFRTPSIIPSYFELDGTDINLESDILEDVSFVDDGTNIDYIRFFVDQEISDNINLSPLLFVSCSEKNIFPYVMNIEEDFSYFDVVVLERGLSGIEKIPLGKEGLDLDIICLLQREIEKTDVSFEVISSPYIEDFTVSPFINSIAVTGTSYCQVDGTEVECPCYGRLIARKTGSPQDKVFGPWTIVPEHALFMEVSGLEANCSYNVLYFLRSTIGPDTPTYMYMARVKTLNIEEIIGE